MPFRTPTFLTLASIALGACTADLPKPNPSDPLVGCWAGEDFQPVFQRRAKWFMNRKSDGTFSIDFAANERGVDLPIQIEEGKWNHKDGMYTTLTLRVAGSSVDAKDPQYTDTYEVKSVVDGVFTYFHPKMKLTFSSKKVACERSAA